MHHIRGRCQGCMKGCSLLRELATCCCAWLRRGGMSPPRAPKTCSDKRGSHSHLERGSTHTPTLPEIGIPLQLVPPLHLAQPSASSRAAPVGRRYPQYLRVSPALTGLQMGFIPMPQPAKLWATLRLYKITPFLSTDEPEMIVERKHLTSCTAR